jgi:tRNA-dihydrouridine synthase A
MMEWTDRHCRFFHRLLSARALLYTEMITTGALVYGNKDHHLLFNREEHPLALQLGGSHPKELAQCAKLAYEYGYDEVNLNCGCPSERVQRGAFGACLMNEADLVAQCVSAMVRASPLPVTVKHRIGLGRGESFDFVRDFVAKVSKAGCQTFIVHARNAWLEGLSPKENREIPPLKPDWAYRLKKEFPHLQIVYNGGVQSMQDIDAHLSHVDGVMVGRAAYHNPWLLTQWDKVFEVYEARGEFTGPQAGGIDATVPAALNNYPAPPADKTPLSREAVEAQMVSYMQLESHRNHVHWSSISRHMLGLYHAQVGGKRWRRVWSDHKLKNLDPAEVSVLATKARMKEIEIAAAKRETVEAL